MITDCLNISLDHHEMVRMRNPFQLVFHLPSDQVATKVHLSHRGPVDTACGTTSSRHPFPYG